MSEREEIERLKREMRKVDFARQVQEWLKVSRGSDEDRRIAREELDAEYATGPNARERMAPLGREPRLPATAFEIVDDDYLGLDEIEAKRRELAEQGRPHGYDSLAKVFGKNSRTTIVRRYRGRQPPGTRIAGICDDAPAHTHGKGLRD